MFKQLKYYYVVISLPFVSLLFGSLYFYNAVRSTITRNPHPQINYTIFYIILVGGTLILLSAYRLMHEAKNIVEYSKAVREKTDGDILQRIANSFTGDIAYVLQMISATHGRLISHQEQVAIEHELTNARNSLVRRNALPQYLSGLLVGMGLLGTFVGLLATLSDISTLISSFAELDMATASPLLVFRTMIERMKAPMQSMSIAFSASMFGLLGSIILGLMMLGIRRMQGDIISLLGSEVAKHIEVALSYEEAPTGGSANKTENIQAVSGGTLSGEESAVLTRIEERLTELARVQQRMLSTEIEDFSTQRSEMLRVMTEQTEANNNFRSEMQQLGRQFGTLISSMEKGNTEVREQISELTVQVVGTTHESHKLLALQAEEQKKLRDALDSYKIEERLAEAARLQQRALTAEIDDFQKQRADMLRSLNEHTEASNRFQSELQQLGHHLGSITSSMEKGNHELFSQMTELMVQLATNAKESQKLLAMQVNEQIKLRETLDWRSNNG